MIFALILMLGFNFAVPIDSAAAAAGSSSDTGELAAAQSLHQRLFASGADQARVWNSFTAAEQALVRKLMMVKEVVTTLQPPVGGPSALMAGCGSPGLLPYTRGVNGFGQTIWDYTIHMYLCSDGSTITYTGQPTTEGRTYIAGWGYQGNVSGPNQSYGVGFNAWLVNAQGKFTLTIVPFGVVQEEYPYLEHTQWAWEPLF